MKKRIIKIALMSISMLALASCKQEELVQAASQAVDNNRVVFASVAAYESLFADPNTTDEKVNAIAARYGTFTENARISGFEQAEDTLYSAFLQKILNDDHIVQIGDWIIKVDKLNEQVLVLDKKYLYQYIDLVNSNLNNTNIMVFSTENQVIPMLQEGYTAGSANARVNGLSICGEKNAPNKRINVICDEFGYKPFNFNYQGAKYFDMLLKYDKEGLNFALGYTINAYQTVFNTNTQKFDAQQNLVVAFIGAGADGRFRRKCENSQNVFGEVTGAYNTTLVTKYFHRGTRACAKYDLKARLMVILGDGQTRNLTTGQIAYWPN